MGNELSSANHSTAFAWRNAGDGVATFSRARTLPGARILREPTGADRPRVRASGGGAGSWVVQADGLLNGEEAHTIIQWAEKRFMPGKAAAGNGKYSSSGKRNSSVAWCSTLGECGTSTKVPRLIERVEGATGIGREHFEQVQIVRYFPGQFYREHVDLETRAYHSRVLPHPNPRILTAFVFLNDMTEGAGGETAFTKLRGMTPVRPRLGRLLLWPNVWPDKPTMPDMRMYHEARVVRSGIKYACNIWIRLKRELGVDGKGNHARQPPAARGGRRDR